MFNLKCLSGLKTVPRGHAHIYKRRRCLFCKYFAPSLSGHSKSNLKIPSDRHFLLLLQQPEQATATFLSYRRQQSCISSCPNREKQNHIKSGNLAPTSATNNAHSETTTQPLQSSARIGYWLLVKQKSKKEKPSSCT